MTCIVALEHDGAVWMGADSYIGSDGLADRTGRPKIHRVGTMMFGHAGSSRRNNVLMSLLGPIRPPKRWTEAEVVRRVVPAMIRVLEDHGVRHRYASGDDDCGATLLCASGRVFEIGSAMAVTRSAYGYAAIGSGEKVALGCLAGTADLPPRKRIIKALEAAERHTPTARRPWKILKAPTGAEVR